jgi:hypothetical protein
MNDSNLPRIDRRTAIKWMLTASAGMALAPHLGLGQVVSAAAVTSGYGTDPNLLKTYQPGELWPLTFSPLQRQTAAVLCDVIIPADATSPAASSLGVHDFVDEWVSAPYPAQLADRPVILEGLDWLHTESQHRFGQSFANLILRQQKAICGDVCYEPAAKPEFKRAAIFFNRFRDLTAGGFYTTPEGMKDIRYTGNVALEKFDGPPAELIAKLGLA